MKLPHVVRDGLGAVASRIPDLPDIKSVAERAPAVILNTALKGAEVGAAGYAAVSRTAGQLTQLAGEGVSAARGLLQRSEEAAVKAPTEDPYMGGPLHPTDDLREALFLTQDDASEVDALPGGETLNHDELPLADFDHLTLGELRARIRRLGVGELVQLREYEHAHADRLPVIKAFDNRLASLAKASAPGDAPAP